MGKITTFVIGGLVGACAALALTPKTGEQMRATVVDQVTNAKENLQGAAQNPQQAYQEVKETAANLATDATQFAQDAADQVKDKVADFTGNPTKTEDDELRQKIEAARQRIAEQVAQNAAESRAAVEDADSPVVEAVEDVTEAVAAAVAPEAPEAPKAPEAPEAPEAE